MLLEKYLLILGFLLAGVFFLRGRILKISEVRKIVIVAKGKFQKLKVKYNYLDAELVIANGYGQVPIDFEVTQLVDKAASVFVNTAAFKECSILWRSLRTIERANADLGSSYLKELSSQLRAKVVQQIESLEIDERTCFELRFGELDYDLIAQLQRDPLVAQALTPQARGSIRISLGSLQALKQECKL